MSDGYYVSYVIIYESNTFKTQKYVIDQSLLCRDYDYDVSKSYCDPQNLSNGNDSAAFQCQLFDSIGRPLSYEKIGTLLRSGTLGIVFKKNRKIIDISYNISYSLKESFIIIEIIPDGKINSLSVRYSEDGNQTILVINLS